jgi:hypothetical protein
MQHEIYEGMNYIQNRATSSVEIKRVCTAEVISFNEQKPSHTIQLKLKWLDVK